MRINRRGTQDERLVLTGMIVDDQVCARIFDRWSAEHGGLFRSRWANLIASWAIEYFTEYEQAPRAAIETQFQSWAEDQDDEKMIALVEKFLDHLSDEYESQGEQTNAQFILDKAAVFFNRVKLERHVEDLQAHLDSGKTEDANAKAESFNRIEIGEEAAVDVLTDKEAIRQAFENTHEVLIKYPGALGSFFGPFLERDGFIAFTGSDKRGKTWWLMDLAWRGILQHRKVAFFSVGDLSQSQAMMRFMIRNSRHPLKAGTIEVPTSVNPEGEVDLQERTFREDLDWRRAWKACRKTLRRIRSKASYLRLSCHPNDSINVNGIDATIQSWERKDGFSPDVIVIDYADVLADPPGRFDDGRGPINKTWKQLRALSQKRHCLVVTATQADTKAYSGAILTRTNFSDDKRKNAHVTGMVGLNPGADHQENTWRLNWVVLREGRFSDSRLVHVAGCLDIGNPAIRSCWDYT